MVATFADSVCKTVELIHNHVSQCRDNPTHSVVIIPLTVSGIYFDTLDFFNKIHSKKRCVFVSEYLRKTIDL